ncbi:putative cardiolipin synthase [Papilio xuthus]|uniref:cardiolipin synthase (CMP-forming) n=1 Tax=Papilio xuthus TaxID=66420 RepID=A0A194PGF6_PAPXU|nr:putative cardiolipin synthase [Papilio xuthus]
MNLINFRIIKQVQTLCRNHVGYFNKTYSTLKVHTLVIRNRNNPVKYKISLSSAVCVYSSDSKKHFLDLEKKAVEFKDAFEHKKEQIKETEHRIRQKGVQLVKDIKQQKEITGQKIKVKKDYIIKDLQETKAKVKEKIEEVVERENVFTIPNILCVARITMSPYLGYVILQNNYNLALGLLVFAGVTDLLDGWIARTWKSQSSKMGSFLDPMADKVLVATLFVCLTWQDLIPLSLTLLIIARDVVLVAAGFVIRYKSLPPPVNADSSNSSPTLALYHLAIVALFTIWRLNVERDKNINCLLKRMDERQNAIQRYIFYGERTLSRYFDVTHATAQLAPTFISKVNTAIQLLLVGTTLASPVFDYVHHPALQVLCGVTAASTVVSALSYLISKDTYKILKKKL